jgi:site-specific recombinase XerD
MGVTDTPKSHAGRVTPMAEEVSQALAALGLRENLTEPQDRVFVGRDGGYVDPAAFRKRFHLAQDRAGVKPRRDVRQLRNTFGTVCASEGVPLRTLQEWMGHESITTTEIYASFMPRHEDAAIVSRAFGRTTPVETSS